MSGRGSKSGKDECSGASGWISGLVLAAGAGLVGYLANDVYKAYQEQQREQQNYGSGSTSSNATGSSRPRGQNSWEDDSKKTVRKKNRDKAKNNKLPDSLRCIVCIDNPREVVLHPCSHVCVCEDCLEKLESLCPVCRNKIEGTETIFLS